MSKKKRLTILFKPYISILFLRDLRAGALLALLSFLVPSVGFLGFVAVLGTIAFAEILRIRQEYLRHGFYLYNSLLVGFGVGFFYQISFLSVFLAALLGIFTFVLSFGLNRVFAKYNLPILSLPFSLVSILFYLASLHYSNLLDNLVQRRPLFSLQLPWSDFWRSLGEIYFLPYDIAGLVIAAVILWYSRILFFAGVIGYVIGVGVHALFLPWDAALHSLYNFNFILIAMALGAIFLVPHIKSYLIAAVAIVAAVIIIDAMEVFFNLYSLPVYTIPFNAVTLLFILLLWGVGYELFAYEIKSTPEKTLVNFLDKKHRFGLGSISIELPFIGEWEVYQGFDGKWTHKGSWRYAYDFIKTVEGKSYSGSGEFLEEYYAYGEDVTAPVSGYVVAQRGDLPDNPIGTVDRINNWGNYIIIRSDSGHYVEISHLMQHSIKVHVGEYVKVGQLIAKCGNSGYSPQPHIHIQVQESATLGARTLPFVFAHYHKQEQLHLFALPRHGERVARVRSDAAMVGRLSFILEEVYSYRVFKKGQAVGSYSFRVAMDDFGKFYFDDGSNRLYFFNDGLFFYFYDYVGKESYLSHLFAAAPRMVLASGKYRFEEVLPLYIRAKGLQKVIEELMLAFVHRRYAKKVTYTQDALTLASSMGQVELAFYDKGFSRIVYEDLELRRENA